MAKICIAEGKEGMWVGKIRNLVPKRREHHSSFFGRVGRSSGQCYEKAAMGCSFSYSLRKPLGMEVLKLMREQKRVLRRLEYICHL